MSGTADPTSAAAAAAAQGGDLVALMNSVIEQAVPPMHGLGIHVLELEPGHVIGAAPIAGNANHLGTMYAGTLFGLAEMLGGALFAPSFDATAFYPTVKDLQIRYRRPASTDVRAEAFLDDDTIARMRTECETLGKAEFVLEVQITDAAGELVATTVGTYQVRAYRMPAPASGAEPSSLAP